MYHKKEAILIDHDNYYNNQTGGRLDFTVYRGSPLQRGSGLFSKFIRKYGFPVAKY